MQPGFMVSWSQVIGASVGFAIPFGVLVTMQWSRKSRKKEFKERPPQREKILRPAGYSAMCRVDDIADDLLSHLLMAFGSGGMSGMAAGILWPLGTAIVLGRVSILEVAHAPGAWALVIMFLVFLLLLLLLIWELRRVRALLRDLHTWRFGLRGEQAVAETLARPELRGYSVFHDVPAENGGKEFNLDHVVIGPGGVFVLETKARPRRTAKWNQQEHDVFVDGNELRFPWCRDRKAIPQAKGNARWLQNFLQGYLPERLDVEPVVVVPGWYVKQSSAEPPVKVMNSEYLLRYLSGRPRQYTMAELRAAVTRLYEECKTLEF